MVSNLLLRILICILLFRQYYLSPGGCKYGTACRYSHSKEKSRYLEKSELPPPELNFLGLPIRMVRILCFGMLYFVLSLGFWTYLPSPGAQCELILCSFQLEKECPYYMRNGSCAYGSSCRFNHPDPTASGSGDHSPGNYNGESDALPSTEPTTPSLSLNMMSNEHLKCLNQNSAYVHGMHANSEWSEHQVACLSL